MCGDRGTANHAQDNKHAAIRVKIDNSVHRIEQVDTGKREFVSAAVDAAKSKRRDCSRLSFRG
jgi:hypothetical protein